MSLDLFSLKGYSAVSIRDICKLVQIKESSIYYHFKNKQAIFDELLEQFENKTTSMMKHLTSILPIEGELLDKNSFFGVCNHFFEYYLMDDFCNKVIRLMMIEQFNNEEVKDLYERWMFTEPLEFQSSIFNALMKIGMIKKSEPDYTAVKFYSPIFFYAQKWLFSGKLSKETKDAFLKDICKHIQLFFNEMEED